MAKTELVRVSLKVRDDRSGRGWWRRVTSTDRSKQGAYAIVGEQPFIEGQQEFPVGTVLVEGDTDRTARVLVVGPTGLRVWSFKEQDDGEREVRWFDTRAAKLSLCDSVESALQSSLPEVARRLLQRNRDRVAYLRGKVEAEVEATRRFLTTHDTVPTPERLAEVAEKRTAALRKELEAAERMVTSDEAWLASLAAAADPSPIEAVRARIAALEAELGRARAELEVLKDLPPKTRVEVASA